jgi:hypothetical protein
MGVLFEAEFLSVVFLGAGFLLPLVLFRLVRGHARAAAIGATIMMWATIPLCLIEASALYVNFEEHGAPLRAAWWPPNAELLSLLYPPFGLLVAAMLRWLARRQLAADEREAEEALLEFAKEELGRARSP